jgi:Cft2 family RNA processing exonuclease/dsRNA-specific ribonuclease
LISHPTGHILFPKIMNEKKIQLTFPGGADSIGASCTLVEIAETCLLIDCGIRMNSPDRPLPDLSALNGKHLDAILLTHAHTDHTGALPVLCDAFPSVPVIATPPTIDLISILFNDSIKIMAHDREGEIPLYTKAQVERVLSLVIPMGFRQSRTIKDVTVTFLPASHIIGACMIHIASPAGNILFTGDYSVTSAATVPALDRPVLPVDLVISESTYGSRLHEDRVIAENRLVQQVNEIVQNDGKVLIPSFAIGRAQEVILILQNALRTKKLPNVPVYVDGMVRDVCTIYSKYEMYVTSKLAKQIRKTANPFFTGPIVPVMTPQMRNRIAAEGGPCVIIASSGMLTGGASAFYAQKLMGGDKNAILLTGYQDEESPGRALLSLVSKSGERLFNLYGEPVEVKATVATFNLSAHADRLQMASLIQAIRPRTVVLVHGDNDARNSLKNSLPIQDCLLVENGSSLARSYHVNKNQIAAPVELPEKIDIMRVRAIIGPVGQTPVKASDAAQLWFGCKTDAATIDMFVHRLEELGLVKRDDIRRTFFHVLSSSDTQTGSEEFQIECRLKDENPKGKLLEYCMKRKIPFPVFEVTVDNGYHYAVAKLVIGDKEIVSKQYRAMAKKSSEQLAAEDLLAQLPSDATTTTVYADTNADYQEEIIEIDNQGGEHLRSDNHKGKLYEFCAANKIRVPALHHKNQSGMYLVKLKDRRSTFETAWFSSSSKIVSEQAASEAFLSHVKADQERESFKNNGDTETDRSDKTGSDPRPIINKLVQTKQILDFGYDLKNTEQVENQTLFTVCAWAILPDNTRIESPCHSALSKKEAQYRAASEILKKIYQVE